MARGARFLFPLEGGRAGDGRGAWGVSEGGTRACRASGWLRLWRRRILTLSKGACAGARCSGGSPAPAASCHHGEGPWRKKTEEKGA